MSLVDADGAELNGNRAEMRTIKTARPALRPVAGIADLGFVHSAWIVDPHANSIALLQFNREDAE